MLLAVVGGKLSEGINFSDHYGRAVLMVGLPYPNVQSPKLQEQTKYIDRHQDQLSVSSTEYLDNLCMRSVNQSIGRCIRHRHDYAVILLLDIRYQMAKIQERIPAWMQPFQAPFSSFGATYASVLKVSKSLWTFSTCISSMVYT